MKYSKLLQPITINGMELKNRICMTAIELNYCTEGHGQVSEQIKGFYNARAEGGAALMIVGGCRFDEYGAAGTSFISIEDDSYVPGHMELTEGVHQRGGKIALQLYHAGRYVKQKSLKAVGLEAALAPSAVPTSYTGFEMPVEMTVEQIQTVIAKCAAGAQRAKKAGYDAVELVGSAGYLISQFLSPLTNQRTDAYGGSFDNRTRFARELIAAVRQAVGPDYPIIMRVAGNDFVPGSNTNVEAVQFCKVYEACGIDMLDVTGGWHETRIPQLPGDVPHGGFAYLAQTIKAAVSIPVFIANRIQDPYVAEAILEMGQADGVGMCRTLLADPQLPNKAQAGLEKEIRHCVGCNQGCLASTWFGKPVACLVNADAGREYLPKTERAAKSKNLLVVGAGPAGMEFAFRAGARGHQVTIWEKSDRLGGQLHMVATPPGKRDFNSLIPYYEAMLKKHNVTVVTGKEATPESIRAAGFDEVIIAAGAQPRTIEIQDNKGNIPVVTAFDVLDHEVIPGKNVIIVGGGAIGCETAQFLAQQGAIDPEKLFFLTIHKAEKPEYINELVNHSVRTINIVEIAPRVGSGFDAGCAWPVLKDLKRLQVGQYTNAKILSTSEGSALIEYKDKEGAVHRTELPCDTIVLSVGSLPCNGLFDAMKDSAVKIHQIGDGQKVGRVLDAVRQAADLAEQI